MEEMTIEQQRAVALANARARSAGETPVAVDMAKSLAAGVGDAIVGALGLPGDIGNLASWGAEKLGAPADIRAKIGGAVKHIPGVGAFAGPGSSDVRKMVEHYTGEFYKPQTVAGEYSKSIGDFSAGALLPGGAVRRAANVLAPALASETAGQLTKGTGAEPYARAAGALAGGVAAARGISPAPARPEHAALASALESEGIPLTAGQRTGNRPLLWFEAAAADTPLAASKAATINETQGRAFTGAALKRMGMSGGELATPAAIDAGVQRISDKFNVLSARNTLQADRQMVADLLGSIDEYRAMVPASRQASIVEDVVRDIGAKLRQNSDQIVGREYQAFRSRLDKAAKSAEQADPQLSSALKGIRDALDNAMGRSVSVADRQEWKEARRQWANWKTIEKAITGSGSQTAEGYISPSQLRNAVAVRDRGAYARGNGDFAELARAGEAVMKPLPQSGTAPRAAAANTFASLAGMLGGGSVGGPAGAIAGAAIPALVGRGMLSGPMQAWLGNQYAPMTPQQMRALLLTSQMPALPRP